MLRRLFTAALLATSAPALALGASMAQPEEPASSSSSYVRAQENSEDSSVALEVRIRRFTKEGAPDVVLAGAVHIADRAYYEACQERLDACDVVLFEGVRPAAADPIDPSLPDADKAAATEARMQLLTNLLVASRRQLGAFPEDMDAFATTAPENVRKFASAMTGDGWGNPFTLEVIETDDGQIARLTSLGADGAPGGDDHDADLTTETEAIRADANPERGDSGNIQLKLAKALGVEFQTDIMDSSKPHWRNADMTMEALTERLVEVGADETQILKMLDGSSLQAKMAGLLLNIISMSPRMSAVAKMMVIDMLPRAEDLTGAMGDPDSADAKAMKVILEDRNVFIVDYLKDLLAVEGDDHDSIAIFYGAGHMPGVEEMIMADLGYEPGEDEWLRAMSVSPKDANMSEREFSSMMTMMRRMIERQLERQKR